MFNQKSILILFINRNTFQLYGGNLTGIVTLEIPQTVLYDLDVLRKDDLYTFIKQCVKQYALLGTQLVVVLSEFAYFEKVVTSTDSRQAETDILKFFDSVPYESIWTKVYQTEKGKRAVAVNKMLCETLHQGFSLQGIPTKAFIPAFALGAMSTRHALDNALTSYVIKNIDMLSKQALFDPQELGSTAPQPQTESPAVKKKSTLPLLLGVFGLLLAVLAVLVITQLR